MPDLIEQAIMADQLIVKEAIDESTSLIDENNDPPLTCWLTCENPHCFTHGCPNAINSKGVAS